MSNFKLVHLWQPKDLCRVRSIVYRYLLWSSFTTCFGRFARSFQSYKKEEVSEEKLLKLLRLKLHEKFFNFKKLKIRRHFKENYQQSSSCLVHFVQFNEIFTCEKFSSFPRASLINQTHNAAFMMVIYTAPEFCIRVGA